MTPAPTPEPRLSVVAVAAGGALGALARWGIDLAVEGSGHALMWATLAVNVFGCALMGLLVAYVLAHPARHALWRPFLGVGFLGGFTTFSAFAGDAVLLLDEGSWATAAAYIVTTLVAGLLALRLALAGGRALHRRWPAP